jgi:polar amino acid transport system substrate-binding protein
MSNKTRDAMGERGAKRRPWSAVAGLAVLVLAVGGAACRPKTAGTPALSPQDAASGAPALRVGIAPDYPPLAYEEAGKVRGLEADFAEQMGHALGVRIAFVTLPFDDLLPALTAGRVDVVMSGVSLTPARARRVRFTNPYMQVGQMALVRRSDYEKLREPDAMRARGVRVGVQRGTTGEAFVRKELRRAKVVEFDNPEAGIAAVRAGTIDCFVHDAPTVWRVSGGLDHPDPELRGIYRPLTEEYLAWAVRPQDAQLADRLNEALRRWRQSGQLESMIDRWVTVRKVTVEAGPAR